MWGLYLFEIKKFRHFEEEVGQSVAKWEIEVTLFTGAKCSS